jgi:hypothetical protein
VNVNVRIDRLVLEGVELDARQRASLHAAVVGELTRRLSGESALGRPSSDARAVASGTQIELSSLTNARALGRAVASGVCDAIEPGQGRPNNHTSIGAR